MLAGGTITEDDRGAADRRRRRPTSSSSWPTPSPSATRGGCSRSSTGWSRRDTTSGTSPGRSWPTSGICCWSGRRPTEPDASSTSPPMSTPRLAAPGGEVHARPSCPGSCRCSLAAQTDMRWTTSPRLTLELALVRAAIPEADPNPAGLWPPASSGSSGSRVGVVARGGRSGRGERILGRLERFRRPSRPAQPRHAWRAPPRQPHAVPPAPVAEPAPAASVRATVEDASAAAEADRARRPPEAAPARAVDGRRSTSSRSGGRGRSSSSGFGSGGR